MTVTERKNEGLYTELAVQVPAATVQAAIDRRLKEISKKVKLAGFRPGKAPLSLLQQRYGESARAEALDKLVEEETFKALKERNIQPALQPKVDVTKFGNDNELEFTLMVEKMPSIDPSDFGGITLEKFVTPIEDTQIDETLTGIADNYKDSQALETQRPAKMGDIVRIDFDGNVDGKKLPGMNATDFDLELGTHMFVDTFEEQLVGLNAGDQKTVNVRFPDNYNHPELKGRDAVFEVTVKEVREAVPAKIDDALAQKAGVKTLDELKKIIRTQMQGEHDKVTRARLKRALLDALDNNNKFEVPKTMVETEYKQIWQYHLKDLKSRDMDLAEAENDEESKTEFRKIAERRVRLGLLLSEVGERNKITVSNQELQQAVMREAQNYPGQEKKVFEFYQKNRQAVANLRAPLYEEKVVDYILGRVKLNEKQVSKEELLADPDEEMEAGRISKGEGKTKAKKTAKKKVDV